MTFGKAIEYLWEGQKVQRTGWNDKGMWLMLRWNDKGMWLMFQQPDAYSKMTLPYIYMGTVTGDLEPWRAPQTDMLASDWRVATLGD